MKKSSMTLQQFVGKDSLLHTYNFRDIDGENILKSITIQKVNGSGIIINYLEFDTEGKISKVIVTDSQMVVKKNGASQISYNSDFLIFKDTKVKSIVLTNEFKPFISFFKRKNFLVSKGDGIDYPIYNYKNINNIKIKAIGKGVSPKLDTTEYINRLEDGIFRRYK